MVSEPVYSAAGRLAIYEQRKGARVRCFDAYVETERGERLKINWKDSTGRIRTSWVSRHTVRLMEPRL